MTIADQAQWSQSIPTDADALSKNLDKIDQEVMTGAISDRFLPKERLQQLLLQATALFSFFSNRYWTWKAILDNQELNRYMELKNAAAMIGEKFVSAPAERDASHSVAELRYVVSFYQGQLARCEQYIHTLKKLLDTLEADRQKMHNAT